MGQLGYRFNRRLRIVVSAKTCEGDQGNAEAQSNLGNMYYTGTGVQQSYKEAVKWYRLVADQGNADAKYKLEYMYGNGQGVPHE